MTYLAWLNYFGTKSTLFCFYVFIIGNAHDLITRVYILSNL